MTSLRTFVALFFFVFQEATPYETTVSKRYEPNWKSLDSRPIPQWYNDAKIGIFIHFGVFSVPSWGTANFWGNLYKKDPAFVKFMEDHYRPGFTYADFAKDFTLEFFDPKQWVQLFEKSGARYAVLTSKHTEGYSMSKTMYNFNWNSVDVGPNRDIVGEFRDAMQNSSLTFGLYHCLADWGEPIFVRDALNNYTTRDFPTQKTIPRLHELVENYQPQLLWSDCNWKPSGPEYGPGPNPNGTYWGAEEFLAWLYNDSPVKDTVVVNDRWETGTVGEHGGFYNYRDQTRPNSNNASMFLSHKWECCMIIDKKSWIHRRDATLEDFRTHQELVCEWVLPVIAYGGNILIDVGPTKEGTIPVIMEERLTQLGEWLQVNGEAIFDTKPWTHQEDNVTASVHYTTSINDGSVFASFCNWPETNEIVLGIPKPSSKTKLSVLGTSDSVQWEPVQNGIKITLPDLAKLQHVKSAWVIKFTNI